MTKSELLKAWQKKASKHIPGGLSMARHDVLLSSLGKVVADELAGGVEVPLPHIGKLKVRDVAARAGRNPATGEPVEIPAKRRVVLTVGKELKEAMNA